MTPQEIRALFPGTRESIYLNAAAAGLTPAPVAEAIRQALARHVSRGIGAFREDRTRIEATRAACAGLVGARSQEIAFVANTAEGIARVADGLPWNPGDEVVLCDLEYPANVYPWAAQRDRGVRLRVVSSRDGRVETDAMIAAIGPRTRVVAVSLVQFTSGHVADVDALGRACAERDVLLAVDAIQGIGVVPVDVARQGIGALACDGRKWLLGPAGGGFVYVAPEWAERIRPRAAGALSVKRSDDHLQWVRSVDAEGALDLEGLLRDGAGRFESGFPNVLGITGLGAALEVAERIGRDAIRRAIAELAGRLVRGCAERGWPVYGPRSASERAGIVAFSIPADAAAVWRALDESGISVAVRDGRLRVSPHAYNTAEEIDALLDAADRLVAAASRR